MLATVATADSAKVQKKSTAFLCVEKRNHTLCTLRAALTTHELEWLEPWAKLAELELEFLNRELVYVGNTNVTQGT